MYYIDSDSMGPLSDFHQNWIYHQLELKPLDEGGMVLVPSFSYTDSRFWGIGIDEYDDDDYNSEDSSSSDGSVSLYSSSMLIVFSN